MIVRMRTPTTHLEKIFYRPAEAARVLSIGRTRLYDLMRTGEVESVKVGASRLIPAEALLEFAERLCQKDLADDSRAD